jgi:hypothetical protein
MGKESSPDFFEIDAFVQADLWIQLELQLPVNIPVGEGSLEARAIGEIETLSSNLLNRDNSFCIIDNSEIVFVKLILPDRYKIQPGSIVKPAHIQLEEALPDWLVRKFGLENDNYFNYDYDSYYQVVEVDNECQEIVIICLRNGKRRSGLIKNFSIVGYAGKLELVDRGEKK